MDNLPYFNGTITRSFLVFDDLTGEMNPQTCIFMGDAELLTDESVDEFAMSHLQTTVAVRFQ